MMSVRRSLWLFIGVMLLAFAIAVPLGCGGGGGPSPPSPPLTLTLYDASGRTVTEINEETLPTLFTKITGLPPNKPFELMLYRDGQPLYRDAQGNLQPITVTSDEKGEILRLSFSTTSVLTLKQVSLRPLQGVTRFAFGAAVLTS
jgi:hypothetical protein